MQRTRESLYSYYANNSNTLRDTELRLEWENEGSLLKNHQWVTRVYGKKDLYRCKKIKNAEVPVNKNLDILPGNLVILPCVIDIYITLHDFTA